MNTINDSFLQLSTTLQMGLRNGWAHLEARRKDERGEGVISTAIAVLIVVGIGAAMWLAYKQMFDDVADKTNQGVTKIGS